MDEPDAPLKDTGSFSHTTTDLSDDIAGHHTDKWQHHAMYVGLHFPGNRGHSHKKRHHKHKHHHKKPKSDEKDEDEPTKPSTPPSQRVQFILGGTGGNNDEDHQTHDIFCEMEELRGVGEDMEWKETARWIKFEEDVEEGGERWSKPFVATLALHSLFELRKGIMSGTVMLDLDAVTLPQIVNLVLDNLIAAQQVEESQREQVCEVLLSRHRHQHSAHDKKGLPIIRSLAEIGRKTSEKKFENKGHGDRRESRRESNINLTPSGSHPALDAEGCPTPRGSLVNIEAGVTQPHNSPRSRLKKMFRTNSSGHLTQNKLSTNNIGRKDSGVLDNGGDLPDAPSQHKFNEHFAKKIPAGAEASNILVGEVDFLSHPIMAFVRLSKAQMLGDLTEVPVPTRFIFVLLGPVGNSSRYHEIGRSIATLMSDEIFHDVAYKAKNRNDLLAAIDEFLDQVVVLPPGEWDPNIRIEPPKSVPSQEGRKHGGAADGANGGENGLPNGSAGQDEEDKDTGPDLALTRTGKLFGGLAADVRRRAPFYLADFRDALHVQCVASIFFMYFACLTPIITFGGLLDSATDSNMAAMESLLAGAICGISYHLFSGQPLTIIGSTGPVLVFETIVYQFCSDKSINLDYLAFRFWIGLWVAFILMLIVAFDLSALVRYITRFTEESFAALIALIFIYEAFKKLFHILDTHGVNVHAEDDSWITCNCTAPNITAANGTTPAPVTVVGADNISRPVEYADYNLLPDECEHYGGVVSGRGCNYAADVFFFSCIIFLGTFVTAYTLKAFRNSRFFPTRVRSIISDFAVMLAIVSMVVVDVLVGVGTPKLEVPQEFKPTKAERKSWFIDPTANPLWTLPAALLPALLATILIFMDQQITAVIVNRKENKLKKGCGYHLDLFVISIQIALCSMLGLPWFVAATVLSINHVKSLTLESDCAAPGEKAKFLGVREQRVTGIIVFLLVGLSVFMTQVLLFIPMPVLFGVFLFMGVSSLSGVQLVQRITIIFMPAKYQPDYIFLRHVPLRRVHLFTAVQVVCLVCLWVIKTIKQISIVFPLMVLAMCFVRKALDWVFTRHELEWLDDILPEAHKREKEEEMLGKDADQGESQLIEMTGGAVNIPLAGGQFIKVPVDRITYDQHAKEVNISDEMGKTAIWKQLVANESNPNILHNDNKDNLRNRKSNKGADDDVEKGGKSSSKKKDPPKFHLNQEDEEKQNGYVQPAQDMPPPKYSGAINHSYDSDVYC